MFKHYLSLVMVIGLMGSAAFAGVDGQTEDATKPGGHTAADTARATRDALSGKHSTSDAAEAKQDGDTADAARKTRLEISKGRMSSGMARATAKELNSEGLVNQTSKDSILAELAFNPVYDIHNKTHMAYIDTVSSIADKAANVIAVIKFTGTFKGTKYESVAKSWAGDLLATYAAEGRNPTAFPETRMEEEFNGYKDSSAIEAAVGILHTYVKNLRSRLPAGEANMKQSVREYVDSVRHPSTPEEKAADDEISDKIFNGNCVAKFGKAA